MRTRFVIALLALPAALFAQGGTISPGMNRAQVVSALGEPATSRTASEYTYLFYRNDCGRACGMNDLVVLRGDSVVDAIFRSPSRKYTGESSSPAGRDGRSGRRGATDVTPAPGVPSWTAPSSTGAERKGAKGALAIRKDAPTQATPTVKRDIPAAAPRTPTPEELTRLRRELLGTGLTTSQIRARLRAQGFAESLLDADIRAAMAPPVQKKPSAPNDTHPSVPAGEPPVRKAPATATPPAPTRPPTP